LLKFESFSERKKKRFLPFLKQLFKELGERFFKEVLFEFKLKEKLIQG